jgi:hypothetical protein
MPFLNGFEVCRETSRTEGGFASSTLPLVARFFLALRLDFALRRSTARPGEENHHQQDCDQKRFTVMHDTNTADRQFGPAAKNGF